MLRKINGWFIGGWMVICAALIAQPLSALCGNCGRYGGEVLGCFASSSSNNYCIVIRCHVEGDVIGFPQEGYCCFDDMACAV